MSTLAERREDPDLYRDPSEPTERGLTEHLRLGKAALLAAMAATTTRVFPARSTIVKEGDLETMVSQVVSGWASCRRTLPDGRTQLTSVVLLGDMIGVSSLVGGSRRESVEARTQMSVQSLSHVEVLRLAAERSNVALWLLWHQSQENKRSNEWVTVLSHGNAIEKIAFLLLDLYRRLKRMGQGCEGSVRVPLTQREIGERLGLTLPHVCRTVALFRERGIVQLRYGGIDIIDPPALIRCAQNTL
jgi:CRP-like cAMP-binding protein